MLPDKLIFELVGNPRGRVDDGLYDVVVKNDGKTYEGWIDTTKVEGLLESYHPYEPEDKNTLPNVKVRTISDDLEYIIGQLEPTNSGTTHSGTKNQLKREQWKRAKELGYLFSLYEGQYER